MVKAFCFIISEQAYKQLTFMDDDRQISDNYESLSHPCPLPDDITATTRILQSKQGSSPVQRCSVIMGLHTCTPCCKIPHLYIFPLAMRAGTTAIHGTGDKTNHKVSHLTGSKPPRMTCKIIHASKPHRVSRCFNLTNVLVFTLAQHFSHCQQSLETRLKPKEYVRQH